MSYAGGTTHYNFPQIVSSDRPTFVDFNEAFRTLDTKLYGLEGDASTTDGRLDTLEGKMGTAEGDIVNLKSADIRIEGKADANAEAITLLQGTVGTHTSQIATKTDMVAIGDVYLTTQGYTEGDKVMYNGQRYVCITTYTTGEPFDADKWQAVDVNTELAQLNSDLASKQEQYINISFTIPSSSSGLVHVNYPDGYDMYKIIVCIRAYDSVNNEITNNPNWIVATCYASDIGLVFDNIPSAYQGNSGYVTMMRK